MSARKADRKHGKGGESFGQSVIDSLTDFLAAAEKGEPITARRVKLVLEPKEYDGRGVRSTRLKLNVSQAVFAQLMGVTVKTVEAWEAGTNKVNGPVCRLLDDMNLDPQGFLRRHLGGGADFKTESKPIRRGRFIPS